MAYAQARIHSIFEESIEKRALIMCLRAALLILLPVVSFAAPPPGIPDGWSDGYVYANGIRIHYYRAAPAPGAPPRAPQAEASAPDRLSVNMFGSPETLVAQNNYNFDDLVATCSRQTPKWDIVDCQYWALSKKQYHGPYTDEAWQAMSGTMATGDSLAGIPVPTLILKADASAEARTANAEAASVMQNGRLVHIDGAGHNLHHDELERTVEALTEFLSTL